jgi:hypothetical protein
MSLTELAAAPEFALAWIRLDTDAFLELLAPDANYAPHLVFDELDSRQAIAEYLRGEMKTVRNYRISTCCFVSGSTHHGRD